MTTSTFRADLEGLRAVAVVLVVLDHLVGTPAGGFIGVDVFFVLSGFLITGLLVREAERTGRISLHDFYVRRARRILPAAVLVAVVTVATSAVLFLHNRTVQVFWDGVASMLFVQNWHLIRASTSYFADDGSGSPLQHYWSLSVEEQFYIVWPWVVIAVVAVTLRHPARRVPVLVALLAGATALSFWIAVVESAQTPARSYFSIESRMWELGVGALVALLLPRFRAIGVRVGSVATVSGLVVLVTAAVTISPDLPFPGPWALVPVVGAVLVIVGGSGGVLRVAVPLTNPVSRWIGRVSYSVYLWHWPAIVLVGAVLPHRPAVAAVIAGTATVVLAAATRRWVEVPFLRHRDARVRSAPAHRAARRTEGTSSSVRRAVRTAGLATGVAALLVVSSAVQMRGPSWVVSGGIRATAAPVGVTTPFPDARALHDAVRSASTAERWPDVTPDPGTVTAADSAAAAAQQHGCLNDPVGMRPSDLSAAASACTFGDPDAPRSVVVLGDSIAVSWLPAVVGALEPEGWSVTTIGLESCPAVDLPVQERLHRAAFPAACATMREAALRAIADRHPDLVLLSSAMAAIDDQTSGATGTTARDALATATATTIARVRATGSRVGVLTSPPESTPPSACALRVLGPATCLATPDPAWEDKTIAEAAGVARADRGSGGVALVDTSGWFCTADGRCPAFVGDTLVKADAGHLTTAYARALAPVLARALDPLTR